MRVSSTQVRMMANMRERIGRAGEVALKAETAILISLITAIVVIVFFGVIVRYTPVTGQTLWTTEIARLLLLWSAFWAAGSVERYSYHFRVDLLDNVLSNKVGLIIQVLVRLVFMVSLGIFLWWIIPHARSVLGVHTYVLQAPQIIFVIPLFFGTLLLFIHALTNSIRLFRKVFE